MSKKIYLCLLVITSVTSAVLLLFSIFLANSMCVFDTEAKIRDLSYYLESADVGINCSNGYVPDAQTAARIGSSVIDHLCDKDITDFGDTHVYYDEENRVWKVVKTYGPYSPSALVIIDQDTGAILKAFYQEN